MLKGRLIDVSGSGLGVVREEKKNNKKEKIVSAACRVFKSKGYHSTTISDIVKETDLARGTFYLYFKSKEEIFDSLLTTFYLEILQTVGSLEVEKWGKSDFFTQLSRMSQALFSVFNRHRDTVRILVTTHELGDDVFSQRIGEFMAILRKITGDMLQRGVAAKRLIKHDTVLMADLVVGSMREFAYQWLVCGKYEQNVPEKVDEIVRVFMRGVEI